MFLTTSRLLAFIPDATGRHGEGGVAAPLAAAGALGLTPLRSHPYFLACEGTLGQRADDSGTILLLDLFPGTIASGRPLTGLFAEGSWARHHETAAGEAQYYNLIEATPEAFRLESDPLGLKPLYLAKVPGGTVMASRIGDIGRLLPGTTREPDPLGVVQFLLAGHPMDERTLHRNIRLAPTGGCFHWRRGGSLTTSRGRRQECPQGDAALGADEAALRLKGAVAACLERRSRSARKPFLLALSGGFDSRLTAALAREMGLPVSLYTYGRSYHREVQVARTVAGRLGFDHHVLRYPTDNLTARMPMHLELVEGQADPHQVQIANLLDIGAADGQALLHGFFGDGACGHYLEWLRPEELESLDGVAGGIARYAVNPAVRRFVASLGLAVNDRDFMRDLRESLWPEGRPYQAMMLWYWENRMRRMVGQQLTMLGTRLDTISPFYDGEVMRICAGLPRIALEHRNIQRFVLQRHFPELARIPHDKEASPIVPDIRQQLSYTARRIPRKLANSLLGQDRVLRLEERFFAWREPDIWRLSFGAATPAERSRTVRRIEALSPDLEKVFGIRLPGVPPDLHDAIFGGEPVKGDRWGHLHALRRLWSLAEYAHQIAGVAAVAAPPTPATQAPGALAALR